MIAVGIDTETTGVGRYSDIHGYRDVIPEIVEVGWCVYDLDANLPLAGGHDMFFTEHWSNSAEEVHKIPRKVTQKIGYRPSDLDLWKRVEPYCPDLVVAHNAEFDHKFVRVPWPNLCNIPWICTADDLPHGQFIPHYNPTKVSKKAKLLAAEYEIPFNYEDLHRAYGDALISCKIAAKHIQSIPRILGEKAHPHYRDIAVGGQYVESFNTSGGHLRLLEKGFKWEGEIDKKWHIKQVVSDEILKWIVRICPEEWHHTIALGDLCGRCSMRPTAL